MRRACKYPDSKIVTDNLKYASGNSNNNKKVAEILLREQKNFCAYTDEYLSRTDQGDIEHFNPTLKGTPDDNYHNWFVVKSQWNKEKSYKWKNFQPILHPTAADFEERVVYMDGDYFAKSDTDVEAKNLITLLQLDDAGLADKRKRYIKRKHEDMKAYQQDAISFFATLINDDICHLSYQELLRKNLGLISGKF